MLFSSKGAAVTGTFDSNWKNKKSVYACMSLFGASPVSSVTHETSPFTVVPSLQFTNEKPFVASNLLSRFCTQTRHFSA